MNETPVRLVVVFAGNRREAVDWARREGRDPRGLVIPDERGDQLRGLRPEDVDLKLVGTYYERRWPDWIYHLWLRRRQDA